MNSWWDLGDWSGFDGKELAIDQLICAFCNEKGNFSFAFQAEKKHQSKGKVIHFDTLKCENCSSYLQATWARTSYGNIHDRRIQPWPLKISKHPDSWPEPVGRYWLQAKSGGKRSDL